MLDLTVEIDGDINSLEEALERFTSTEVLDGENRYQCIRLCYASWSFVLACVHSVPFCVCYVAHLLSVGHTLAVSEKLLYKGLKL